jgi:hypothetical protein
MATGGEAADDEEVVADARSQYRMSCTEEDHDDHARPRKWIKFWCNFRNFLPRCWQVLTAREM